MSAGPHLRFERAAVRRGLKLVAGVDEVGRGPLAGPVAAAAVILDPGHLPRGVDDSKALRARARETVCEDILARAIAVSVAFVEAAEIDRVNIRQATHAAMRRAIASGSAVWKATIPPPSAICRRASACCGWLSSPG